MKTISAFTITTSIFLTFISAYASQAHECPSLKMIQKSVDAFDTIYKHRDASSSLYLTYDVYTYLPAFEDSGIPWFVFVNLTANDFNDAFYRANLFLNNLSKIKEIQHDKKHGITNCIFTDDSNTVIVELIGYTSPI